MAGSNNNWRFCNAAIIVCVTCAILGSAVFNESTSQDNAGKQVEVGIIDQAFRLFDEGRLAEAEHLALKALAESDTLSAYSKFILYKLLAFIAIANDDEENGARQFVMALQYNPTLSPDPITWSPKVRRVFDRARADYEIQEQKRRQHLFTVEAGLCRRASLRSLYLPGGGQYMKGQKQRGFLFGALFWGAASTFIYSQSIIPTARDQYHDATQPQEAEKRWREYQNTIYMANISGLIAFSVYTYAFFDALWTHPHPKIDLDLIEE